MGDVLDGILGGDGDGDVEFYETDEVGSDAESPPLSRRRGSRATSKSPLSGDEAFEEDEEMAREETEEERPLPLCERKFRKVAIPEHLVQPVPPFNPVPKGPGRVMEDITYWGYLPHITVHGVLKEYEAFGRPLASHGFDRSQEEAQKRAEEVRLRAEEERERELERQREAAKPTLPSRFLVVFATPADLDQSMQSKRWPIRNPLTEKALNAALLEEGQVVLLFLSREGFQGHATLLSIVEEEEEESDFLSTWYTIAWGTRAVLPVGEATSFVDPLPAEGVILETEVGSSICEALNHASEHQQSSASDPGRGDGRSSVDRGRHRQRDGGRRQTGRSRQGSRAVHLRYTGEVREEGRSGQSDNSSRSDRRHEFQRGSSEDRGRHQSRDFPQHKQETEFRSSPASEEDATRRRMADLARRGEGGQRPRNRRKNNRFTEWTDDPSS